MLGTAIIVFREVLEAALVISIVCAATRGVAGRGLWVSGGIVTGVLGAGIVAACAGVIAEAASGVGQELFNACVLFAAVAMLGWHNVWMARHGREMAAEMTQLGQAVHDGKRPLYALLVVIGLAVLREGSEVVLFLYGIALGGSQTGGMLTGGFLGLAGGVAMGFVLYFGLLRIPTKHFFSVTGWLILLLAAGMASQAAGFLIQADILPPLGARIWDTSHWVSGQSLLGNLLRALIGYDASPAGAQLLFYIATLIVIGTCMKTFGRMAPVKEKLALTFLAVSVGAAAAVANQPAYAGPADKVYTPAVEYGEMEMEFRGGYLHDPESDEHREQAYVFDIGYGFTPWWFSELVAEYEVPPSESGEVEAVEWENILQLTEPGKYWMDFGLFAEYAYAVEEGHADKIELGPMFQKQFGLTVTNLNLIAEREVGASASKETELEYRLQLRRPVAPVTSSNTTPACLSA